MYRKAGGNGESKPRKKKPPATAAPAKEARTSGRKKGTPNKRTLEIAKRLEKLGCDPLEFLARVVLGKEKADLAWTDKATGKIEIVEVGPNLDQKIQAAKELAQYIAPKRKAIEIDMPAAGRLVDKIERVIVDHTQD